MTTPEQHQQLEKLEIELAKFDTEEKKELYFFRHVRRYRNPNEIYQLAELASRSSRTHPLSAAFLPKMYGYVYVDGEKIPPTVHQNLVRKTLDTCETVLSDLCKDPNDIDLKAVRNKLMKLQSAASDCCSLN
ncbi:hypothetical protein [Photobacterium alginatilyticum]|uniref:Uncharacterized protein n=1 Tax=Photobacterium alginatilyticum TaxID=1775171 RepID=A0ABW9YI66_9GAMM|nr:hypothetical protein [Photobacterium alginatilyticum]NBI53453.1 hypothetical protein [Photobacterium alginatilyticum]